MGGVCEDMMVVGSGAEGIIKIMILIVRHE